MFFQRTGNSRAGAGNSTFIVPLDVELGLHCLEKITVENGRLLAGKDLTPEDDLADIEPVAQKIGERATGKRDPSHRAAGLERSQLGDDPPLAEVHPDAVEAAKREIAAEDSANPLRFLFHRNDPAVLGLISKRGHAADPQPLALGGGNLVANALGGDFPLELGKRQQHIQGQSPHRGGRVELLGDRDERHPMLVEQLDELWQSRPTIAIANGKIDKVRANSKARKQRHHLRQRIATAKASVRSGTDTKSATRRLSVLEEFEEAVDVLFLMMDPETRQRLTLGTTPCPTIGTSATTGTTSTTGTSATTGTPWTTERLNGMATAPGSC